MIEQSHRPSTTPIREAARTAPTRKIIHVDMDAFFASVEQLDEPSLKGKPLAVGGDPASRGVVSAASYEARAYGVRSAMPMSQALRLCPTLICRRPRIGRYIEMSRTILETLRRAAPLVEMASLDEAYLDVSDSSLPVKEIAARLKAEIREATGLIASAGAGPCKLVAKIASDLGKPDGLVVVKPARVLVFLAPLPVSRLWGVGPATEEKLRRLGIRTVGELAGADDRLLASRLGSSGAMLARLARGQDDRPVVPSRKTRSISCERTLPEDTRDIRALDHLIDRFAADLEVSLRDERLRARTVVLKVRYSDFSLISRSRTLRSPFDEAAVIAREGRSLLGRTGAGRRKVRLLGITVLGLISDDEPHQRPLFPQ